MYSCTGTCSCTAVRPLASPGRIHIGLNDPILQASEILTPKQACVTNLKRFKADPAPSLGIPCITRWSAAPYMTTWPRVRARRCPLAARALIGAIAPYASSIAISAAVSNAAHGTARALARTHRQRPRSRQNSGHKPRTVQQATSRVRTSCVRCSQEQRASQRAHRSALCARPAFAAQQAQHVPRR